MEEKNHAHIRWGWNDVNTGQIASCVP
jgi:hypothetical protein